MPRGGRRLPDACVERIAGADLLLHAGDFSTVEVLRELEAIGPPVAGVHGNVDSADLRRLLPEERMVEAEGARIAMVHDAGPRARAPRADAPPLRRRADAVVFGHSHLPLHEQAPDGFQILNPGSPTERRRAPRHTMGLARVAGGSAVDCRARSSQVGAMDLDVLFLGTAGSAPTAAPRPARHARPARRRPAAVRLRRGHSAPAHAVDRASWSSRRCSSPTSTPTTCSGCRAC